MKPVYFIGIDISKLTLDIAVIKKNKVLFQVKIDNSAGAFENFVREIKGSLGCTKANSFYCAESMGLFNAFILQVVQQQNLRFGMENPLQVKRSMGIQRRKNDAIDAVRIAEYAGKHYESIRFWKPVDDALEQLKLLSGIRKRLLKVRVMLRGSEALEKHFKKGNDVGQSTDYIQLTLTSIDTDLQTIAATVTQLIRGDSHLSWLMDIVTSIPGIGPVIAGELILQTNGFDSSWTAKRFASYCGIAPFERQSGTSLTGKPRVSHLANKEIKSLLHLASLVIIQKNKTFLARFYQRKVEEGKNKMSVINALRNKILHRVFACVRKQQFYAEPPLNQAVCTG